MDIDGRIEDSKTKLLDELKEFLMMPSISARAGAEGSFRGCAEWVLSKLEEAGAEAQLMETTGTDRLRGGPKATAGRSSPTDTTTCNHPSPGTVGERPFVRR